MDVSGLLIGSLHALKGTKLGIHPNPALQGPKLALKSLILLFAAMSQVYNAKISVGMYRLFRAFPQFLSDSFVTPILGLESKAEIRVWGADARAC